MKTSRGVTSVFLAAVLAQIPGPRLVAQGLPNVPQPAIQKQHSFDQTTLGAPIADPSAPFVLQATSPYSMSFTPPGGTGKTLDASAQNGDYEYYQSYGTQTALDAAFPDGDYVFSVNVLPDFTLSLTGDLYPNIPQITNGTWNSSGQLVLDPTQSNSINLNTFTGYGTGPVSYMELRITSYNGGSFAIGKANVSFIDSSAFTSYTIPGGLPAGSIFQCSLEYDLGIAHNSTVLSTAVTAYSSTTYFTMVTSGTGSNLPTITEQPTSQTAPLGSNVTFNINFSNGSNVLVQWFKNGIPINQKNPNLTLANIQNSDAASYFAVLVTLDGTYVQSNTVTLTIGSSTLFSPQFTTQPSSQTLLSGSTVVFTANASGFPTPTYEWHFNGNALSDGNGISGSATASLVISGATTANAGNYYCIANNSAGSLQSGTATLSIISTPDVGRLTNISCRAQVGTGANILIAGFAVGGAGTSGSESLLIRGSGPALVPFGIEGTLPDPQLQLYSNSTVLGTNNGWSGNAQITSTAAAVGAFAWNNPSSHDSALIESLPAGPYTAQVAGQSGDTGVALVELYDATSAGTYTPTMARLVNISTRAQVGTGGNILIAGFVIGGSTSETLLIRASGPALIQFGVSGTLPDPQLQLFSGSTVINSNSGWGGNPQISAAAALVGAFSWGSSPTKDSAILVTLPPGAYTAQVSGASGDTGVALVEVYEVP